MRLEAFNVFNHPQFYGPGAVNGNITSPTFGQIDPAAAPRLDSAWHEVLVLDDGDLGGPY